MAKHIVTKFLTIPIGTKIKLSDKQFSKRSHAVKKGAFGLFTVERPIGFKVGEILEISDKVLSKDIRDFIEPMKNAKSTDDSSSDDGAESKPKVKVKAKTKSKVKAKTKINKVEKTVDKDIKNETSLEDESFDPLNVGE